MTTTGNAPATMVQKLLARACGKDHVAIGEVVYPKPDLVTIHDGFIEAAHKELSALGYKAIRNPETVMFVTFH